MRFNPRVSCIVAVLMIAAPAAQAQWTGKAELGVLIAGGNTESTSANTKLDLAHDGAKWRHTLYFGAQYGEDAQFTNAERYEARYQADRKITDKLSWFFALRGEEDRFSGFAYQATASTGVAYQFIDSPTTKFSGSLGAGYRTLQTQTLVRSPAGEVTDRIKGDEDSEPVGTLGSLFEHSFTENTKITNKLLAESGSTNTTVQDDLSLQVNMSKTLALAVGYGVRYNSDPPPPAKATDTLMTVNLVYNIK